jgi:hypothetical protein
MSTRKDKLLVDLFWKDTLPLEEKQQIVTYLNSKGHSLKLFKGETRGGEYHNTHYWDGVQWHEYQPSYEV